MIGDMNNEDYCSYVRQINGPDSRFYVVDREEAKVEAVAMFLDIKPDICYQEWKEDKGELIWEELMEDLCRRFKEQEETVVIEEFHRLK
ncbi:unnamed protein product [Dovyalis caffra]|uniref:Uncharacterized protein n=1 Tax=Dovyalis caffra TaxID=77055 RepID=A0AAV1SUS0_9ROSI|nr:unnamed protein product [Dovyalis caffra]